MYIKVLLIYYLCLNLVTFFLYGLDKRKAKQRQWRISERVLLWLGALGGVAGALAGMQVFRHKTKHIRFLVLNPIFLIGHMVMLYLLLYYHVI